MSWLENVFYLQVFRTDFITAMKVPDSQQIPSNEYILLKDTWRQEWEKGVQVGSVSVSLCKMFFVKSLVLETIVSLEIPAPI